MRARRRAAGHPELAARLAGEGVGPELGARPLKRHLRRTLETELTRAILDGRIADGGHVLASNGDGDEHEILLELRESASCAAENQRPSTTPRHAIGGRAGVGDKRHLAALIARTTA